MPPTNALIAYLLVFALLAVVAWWIWLMEKYTQY
jgi:hypothetical protein